jgi:hypothetical protein
MSTTVVAVIAVITSTIPSETQRSLSEYRERIESGSSVSGRML